MRATDVFPGVILGNGVYSIREFKARTGLQNRALRIARAKGLTIRKVGNVRFIRGEDFLKFLETEACNSELPVTR